MIIIRQNGKNTNSKKISEDLLKKERTKIKGQELLPLTSDYVFKRIFAKEGNEDILKDFLEAILEIRINNVEVQNAELTKETIEDKLSVLDIKAKLDNDKIVDVEIQVKDERNIEHRSTFYLTKMHASQLKIGNSYKEIKKSIVINILKFNYFKRNSYHLIAKMKFEKTKEKEYVEMGYEREEENATEDLEMHFVELQKFKKKNPEASNRLEQWLWLLIGEGEKIKMSSEKNEKIKKAIEALEELSMDPVAREAYEARLKGEINYNSAIITAKDEGKKEGNLEMKNKIAKRLLEKGLDIEEIIKITELTREEIENLK